MVSYSWNTLIPVVPRLSSGPDLVEVGTQTRSSSSLESRVPVWRLFTDASSAGWGASLDLHRVSGTWSRDEPELHVTFWSSEQFFLPVSSWWFL